MKIAMISCGPEGDIRPFQALAHTLQAAGHTVRMCSHDIFAERFQKMGIDYVSLRPHFDKAFYNETFDRLVTMHDPVETLVFLAKRGVLASPHEWFEDCQEAIRGWDMALVHQFDIPGQEAAMKQKVPWATVSLCPGEIKTAYEPPVPYPNLGKFGNRLLWQYVNYKYAKSYDVLVNEFLAEIGSSQRKNIALETTYSSDLTLVAASPALCNNYPDRPNYFKFTGNWILKDSNYTAI